MKNMPNTSYNKNLSVKSQYEIMQSDLETINVGIRRTLIDTFENIDLRIMRAVLEEKIDAFREENPELLI